MDTNNIDSTYDKFPQLTGFWKYVNIIRYHWKACLIIFILVCVIGFGAYLRVSSEPPPPVPHQDILIEGIYYGEYTDVENCEPFPATVTRSSNGADHYLLSSQGQVYDFWYNTENGSLASSALGSGTLEIDTVSDEIIIKFEGWVLKR